MQDSKDLRRFTTRCHYLAPSFLGGHNCRQYVTGDHLQLKEWFRRIGIARALGAESYHWETNVVWTLHGLLHFSSQTLTEKLLRVDQEPDEQGANLWQSQVKKRMNLCQFQS